jgi:hypothetical protein
LIRSDARNYQELQRQEIEEIAARGTVRHGYNVSPGGSVGTPDAITIAGVCFASHSAAAEHFGIDPTVFNIRPQRLGWTPEQAAEIEPRGKYGRHKVQVGGQSFKSLKSAAECLGLDYKLVHDRMVAKGWTLEQALEVAAPPPTVKYRGTLVTAFGVHFPSLNACAKHHGVKAPSLILRMAEYGESLETAITHLVAKPRSGAQPKPVTAFGTLFKSIGECASHFGLSPHSIKNRMRYQNCTLEQAISYLQQWSARRNANI